MPLSVDQLASAVVKSGLVSADEMKALWAAIPAGKRPKDGDGLAKTLVEAGKLTEFQAGELASGSDTPLALGDYLLLARIGAGGMGQVFKAEHRHMRRLAAIKLLPAALTKDEAAVRRFQREVQAAAMDRRVRPKTASSTPSISRRRALASRASCRPGSPGSPRPPSRQSLPPKPHPI